MGDERQRWNRKYAARGPCLGEPAAFITALAPRLSPGMRALDLAGGAGRHAIWLAGHELDVTLVDISDEGIARAEAHALEAGVRLRTQRMDLTTAPFPEGPWDLIVSFHYLQADLLSRAADHLRTSGLLAFCQPTTTNLERHPKPSRRFLVELGAVRRGVAELASLQIISYEESWGAEGRHEVRLLAERRRTTALGTR